MRYLNKVIFLNSAHIPYAEIRVDGNVHFIGTQGVGKSTLLRAILFFYNADKLHLGIPKEKQNFDAFYLPYANSYIVYEVVRENSAYSVVVSKSMGRAAFRLIDAPYRKAWFVNDRHEVSADWSEVRTRILESDARCTITPLVTSYEMFRDIIFGNNRKPDMVSYRKFAIVESSKYRLEYISEHTFYFGCIFCIPSVSIFICCICISHDFCCVYQHKSLKAGTKRIVRTFYFL